MIPTGAGEADKPARKRTQKTCSNVRGRAHHSRRCPLCLERGKSDHKAEEACTAGEDERRLHRAAKTSRAVAMAKRRSKQQPQQWSQGQLSQRHHTDDVKEASTISLIEEVQTAPLTDKPASCYDRIKEQTRRHGVMIPNNFVGASKLFLLSSLQTHR